MHRRTSGTRNRPWKPVSGAALAAVLGLSLCALLPAAPALDARRVRAGAATADRISFAVIGDSGTGTPAQFAIARAMAAYRQTDRFDFVVMLGDNIYGRIKGRRTFEERFETPYAALLDRGVKFYAVLGNHGNSEAERNYEKFNMEGRRYYTFTRGEGLVQFFALDSSGMSVEQLAWFEKELASSHAAWKIALLHHPLYSSARKHGPSLKLRRELEPLLVKYQVNVVLAGHEHVYERLKPQQGVSYFISGAAGYVRRGNIKRSGPDFAAGYDDACTFMVFEVRADSLRFRAINAKGEAVDSGTIPARATAK